MGTMHPEQEHTDTLGISCSIQRPTELFEYERKSILTRSVTIKLKTTLIDQIYPQGLVA